MVTQPSSKDHGCREPSLYLSSSGIALQYVVEILWKYSLANGRDGGKYAVLTTDTGAPSVYVQLDKKTVVEDIAPLAFF